MNAPNPAVRRVPSAAGSGELRLEYRGFRNTEVNREYLILARLADWSGTAGEDCPLPELYRSLSLLDSPPTIGAFHDCLRQLHDGGAIYLHPWTGPLYAIPEPPYALLVGHNVAYYASLRTSGVRSRESGVSEEPAPLRLGRTDS